MSLPNMLEALPTDTREFTLPKNPHSISKLFHRELYRHAEPGNNPYLILHNCSPEFIETIYENPRAYDMPKIWIWYNEAEHFLIAKRAPDRTQEVIRSRLMSGMSMKIMRMGDGLCREYMGLGRTTWDVDVNGVRYRKEADDSYKPMLQNLPRDQWRILPTIVVQRGYMDFIERYRVEAKWWLMATRAGKNVKNIKRGLSRCL